MPQLFPIYEAGDARFDAGCCRRLAEAVARQDVVLHAFVHGQYPGQKVPAEVLPGLKTAGFWDANADQRWGLPYHRDEGIEITLPERGPLGFEIEQHELLLRPGQFTVTRPWQGHRVGNPRVTAGRLNWVLIDVGVRRPNQEWNWPSWLLPNAADQQELTDILRHSPESVWPANAELKRAFHNVAQIVASEDMQTGIPRLTVGLNYLLLVMLDVFRRRGHVHLDDSLSSSRHTVRLFLEDLKAHPEFLEIDWSLDSMAHSCGLKPTQFVEHVRALTNMTPARYLGQLRLSQAARLLQQEPLTEITDIALRCGFTSSQYFATTFLRRYGMQPRHFRERVWSRVAATQFRE